MFCSKCGTEVSGSARFCPACGSAMGAARSVGAASAPGAAPAARRPRGRKPLVIGAVVVVVALVVAAVLLVPGLVLSQKRFAGGFNVHVPGKYFFALEGDKSGAMYANCEEDDLFGDVKSVSASDVKSVSERDGVTIYEFGNLSTEVLQEMGPEEREGLTAAICVPQGVSEDRPWGTWALLLKESSLPTGAGIPAEERVVGRVFTLEEDGVSSLRHVVLESDVDDFFSTGFSLDRLLDGHVDYEIDWERHDDGTCFLEAENGSLFAEGVTAEGDYIYMFTWMKEE